MLSHFEGIRRTLFLFRIACTDEMFITRPRMGSISISCFLEVIFAPQLNILLLHCQCNIPIQREVSVTCALSNAHRHQCTLQGPHLKCSVFRSEWDTATLTFKWNSPSIPVLIKPAKHLSR